MSKSATLPTDLSSPGSFAIFSPPQAVCAAAAGAHTAPPSSSCPGTPGPGPLDPTPGNSPALPPSAGRYARRRGPASTPAAAAAWPPATSEPAPAQAGVSAYRVAGHVQLLGNPPNRTASAFHFVDLFHLSHLQQCVSRTSAECLRMMPPPKLQVNWDVGESRRARAENAQNWTRISP